MQRAFRRFHRHRVIGALQVLRDEIAALVAPLQQAALGEQGQRRPHRRARDMESLGRQPLRDVIAGFQILLPQPGKDAFGEGGLGCVPARQQTAGFRNAGSGGRAGRHALYYWA